MSRTSAFDGSSCSLEAEAEQNITIEFPLESMETHKDVAIGSSFSQEQQEKSKQSYVTML